MFNLSDKWYIMNIKEDCEMNRIAKLIKELMEEKGYGDLLYLFE